MAEIISITNDKGGVGKTTTAVNIAVGLAQYPFKKKVLVIDLDAQADASDLLGWELQNEKQGYPTIYSALAKNEPMVAYESAYENVYLVAGSTNINDVEGHLRSRDVAILALRELFDMPIKLATDGSEMNINDFDYIFIDCPGALNLITKNALAAADSIIIPLQLEALAIRGLGGLLEAWVKIKKTVNPKLEIKGIVRCMENKQLKLSKGLNDELEKEVSDFLCKTRIPRSTVVPTSQVEHNATIDSNPYSDPALAYKNLIKELFA